MIRSVVIVLCLAVSYFAVFLMIANHWGQALMYGVYGSLVVSLALFVTSCISRGQPSRVSGCQHCIDFAFRWVGNLLCNDPKKIRPLRDLVVNGSGWTDTSHWLAFPQ